MFIFIAQFPLSSCLRDASLDYLTNYHTEEVDLALTEVLSRLFKEWIYTDLFFYLFFVSV